MRATWLALALVVGCRDEPTPDDASPPVDTGSDAAENTEPALPEPPRPVDWGACAPGWTPTTLETAHLCSPGDGTLDCAANEQWLPGDRCVHVGAACAEGRLDAAGVIHVDASAEEVGDGSLERPYSDLESALAAAVPGSVVALAGGRYTWASTLPAGVELRGACADETRIDIDTTIDLGDGATLGDVALTIGAMGKLHVPLGSAARIEGVAIEAGYAAIAVEGDLAIDNVSILGSDSVAIEITGNLDASRLTIDGAEMAINLYEGAASFDDVAIIGTGASYLIYAGEASDLTMSHYLVAGIFDFGLEIVDEATATLRDGVVTSTRDGWGMETNGAGQITLTRTHMALPRGYAFGVYGGPFDAEDLVVESQSGIYSEDAEIRISRYLGLGIVESAVDVYYGTMDIEDLEITGATISAVTVGGECLYCTHCRGSMRRVRLHNQRFSGITTLDGGVLDIEDIYVGRMQGIGSNALFGFGVNVQEGSHVTGRRIHVSEARSLGIFVAATDTRCELTDVTVDGTLGSICPNDDCPFFPGGIGVGVYLGSSATMERFAITDGKLAGVQVARGGMLDLRRGLVARNPIGVNAQDGADLATLQGTVEYVDNVQALDSQRLPVPDFGPSP